MRPVVGNKSTMREYRLPRVWRVTSYFFCIVFVLLAAYLIQRGITFEGADVSRLLLFAGAAASMALSWYVYKDTRSGRLILDDEKVTLISPFGSKTLSRNDIRGFEVTDNFIVVRPRDRKMPTLRISTYLENQREIRNWFNFYIPNLELAEWQEEVTEVLRNEELGLFTEDRLKKLAVARKIARAINISSWIVTLWIIFYPAPYTLAITTGIVLPWIALAACYSYRNLMKGGDREKSAYPSVTEGFVLPGFALLLRVLFDYDILDYSNAWLPVGCLTIAMFVLYQLPVGGFSPRSASAIFLLILFPIFTFAYSFGTVLLINCVADKSVPETFQSTIASKRTSKGRTTTYYLDVKPWGNLTHKESVTVSRNEYERASPGDPIKINQYAGAFRIRWIEVAL